MLKNVYYVLDANGKVVGHQDSAQDAIAMATRAAKRDGGGVYATLEQLDPITDVTQNPPGTAMSSFRRSMLEDRIRTSGGEQITNDGQTYYAATKDSVMAISLVEAQKRLNDWFPMGKKYRTVGGASKGFFQPNTKMEKEATELFERAGLGSIAASSYGLALLPHFVPFRGGTSPSPQGAVFELMKWGREKILEHYAPESDKGETAPSWCAYSSQGCRATCLVYSGQNQVADESIVYKHAMAAALRHDPMAFIRLMVENLRQQMNYKGKAERWARLNVYQDLPWEVIFPELFSRAGEDKTSNKVGGWVPSLRTYDYTKTPRRDFYDNYNLTFSYSGENLEACKKELRAGRNVAAVFLLPDKAGQPLQGTAASKREKQPIRKRHMEELFYPLDVGETFGVPGIPVLNGDVHDIRPYDRQVLDKRGWNGAALVGLDYKIPRVKTAKGRAETLDSLDKAGKFVVRIQETAEGYSLVAGGIAASMLTKID
jgi:hypothetical protein